VQKGAFCSLPEYAKAFPAKVWSLPGELKTLHNPIVSWGGDTHAHTSPRILPPSALGTGNIDPQTFYSRTAPECMTLTNLITNTNSYRLLFIENGLGLFQHKPSTLSTHGADIHTNNVLVLQ